MEGRCPRAWQSSVSWPCEQNGAAGLRSRGSSLGLSHASASSRERATVQARAACGNLCCELGEVCVCVPAFLTCTRPASCSLPRSVSASSQSQPLKCRPHHAIRPPRRCRRAPWPFRAACMARPIPPACPGASWPPSSCQGGPVSSSGTRLLSLSDPPFCHSLGRSAPQPRVQSRSGTPPQTDRPAALPPSCFACSPSLPFAAVWPPALAHLGAGSFRARLPACPVSAVPALGHALRTPPLLCVHNTYLVGE